MLDLPDPHVLVSVLPFQRWKRGRDTLRVANARQGRLGDGPVRSVPFLLLHTSVVGGCGELELAVNLLVGLSLGGQGPVLGPGGGVGGGVGQHG